ncbi:MAG: hypothetical protein JNM00_13130 [Flavobacteriales bacterium]|nr:hypothetical protein [Flavobacteriales bacterium]
MNKKNLMLFAATAAVVLVACKKDTEETPMDSVTATIEIHEPVAGHVYEMGDTVFVEVHINANTEIHGYEAYLINETEADTVWSDQLEDHGTAFNFDGFWVNDVTDHSDMRFEVSAILDHDGNKTTKEVEFHCHPM